MRSGDLRLRVGPFNVEFRTSIPTVSNVLGLLYDDYAVVPKDGYRHFQLAAIRPLSHRRWIRPYTLFIADGARPFEPMPRSMAFPMLEWGFNWQVAVTAHQFLMLHAGVVERNGVTVVLPATPGSGKSTLAAALMYSGWRLLSDEFGLVRPGTTDFVPFPRPIPLKNESIEVLRSFAPDALIGPVFRGTRKGDVAHCRPTEQSVLRDQVASQVTHVVFPRFEKGTRAEDREFPKGKAFMKVCGNSFNYEILGEQAFRTVGDIVEQSDCRSFVYSDLDEAIAWFDQLRPSRHAQ